MEKWPFSELLSFVRLRLERNLPVEARSFVRSFREGRIELVIRVYHTHLRHPSSLLPLELYRAFLQLFRVDYGAAGTQNRF